MIRVCLVCVHACMHVCVYVTVYECKTEGGGKRAERETEFKCIYVWKDVYTCYVVYVCFCIYGKNFLTLATSVRQQAHVHV